MMSEDGTKMVSAAPRPGAIDEDGCWAAVCARDAQADGRFVFAVRTTGVFCRPQCAARRPLRANVTFFADAAAARTAGFRACKRCRPDGLPPSADLVALVSRACRTIETAQTPPTLTELAAAAGRSPFAFGRSFKRIVGVSPREYAAAKRAESVRRTLPAHASVTDALYDAGFGSSSRFYSLAAQTLGMSPTAYQAGGRGQQLRWAAVETALGWVAVACSDRGVAAIELADERHTAHAQLAQRLPAAELREDPAGIGAVLAQIVAFVDRPTAGLDLALDVQGTAFTRRVWRALVDLAPGQTATYSHVAQAVGQPSAARAVAAACAANPVALAIPCHRVVPTAGGVGGYRWGSARKRALLEAEAQPVEPSSTTARRLSPGDEGERARLKQRM